MINHFSRLSRRDRNISTPLSFQIWSIGVDYGQGAVAGSWIPTNRLSGGENSASRQHVAPGTRRKINIQSIPNHAEGDLQK